MELDWILKNLKRKLKKNIQEKIKKIVHEDLKNQIIIPEDLGQKEKVKEKTKEKEDLRDNLLIFGKL